MRTVQKLPPTGFWRATGSSTQTPPALRPQRLARAHARPAALTPLMLGPTHVIHPYRLKAIATNNLSWSIKRCQSTLEHAWADCHVCCCWHSTAQRHIVYNHVQVSMHGPPREPHDRNTSSGNFEGGTNFVDRAPSEQDVGLGLFSTRSRNPNRLFYLPQCRGPDQLQTPPCAPSSPESQRNRIAGCSVR